MVHECVNKNNYPYECQVCSRKFADKRNLNKHIQHVHNKVFPFTCQICNKGFPQGKGFREHVTKHHPQLADRVCTEDSSDPTTAELVDAPPASSVSPPPRQHHQPQQHHHQPPNRFELFSPFSILQSAMSDQQDMLQQGQNGGPGQGGITVPPITVPNPVNMTTTMTNPHQLMSFEGYHMGVRAAPLDTRNMPFDARILHVDDQAFLNLDARNTQPDRNPQIQNNTVPIDNRVMQMNNRSIQMDGRNMPIDNRNIHLDSRNIPLDGRNIHHGGQSSHVHHDNRNNSIGNFYQY